MEPVTSIIIGIVVAGVGATITAFIKKKINKKSKIETLEEKITELENQVDQNRKQIWRLKKTALIQAKILDAQLTKYHDEEIPDLVNISEELLNEEPES